MKRLLPFKKWLAVFLFLFNTLAFSKELPNILELKYDLTQNGESLGTVIEKFMIDEQGNYHIESITKGVGLYALFGDRVLMSEGKITIEGLKPKRFEVHQGSNASKNAIVDFDWDNKILITQYKGSETKENIENKSNSTAIESPDCAIIATLTKETSLKIDDIENMTPRQIFSFLDGIIYNENEKTEEGKKKNRSTKKYINRVQDILKTNDIMYNENKYKDVDFR